MMMGIEVWGPMHKSAVKNTKFLTTADACASTQVQLYRIYLLRVQDADDLLLPGGSKQ
jgi:hypothetical protein